MDLLTKFGFRIICLKHDVTSIERRSVMSVYHGGKISGSEQSFLTEMAICFVK